MRHFLGCVGCFCLPSRIVSASWPTARVWLKTDETGADRAYYCALMAAKLAGCLAKRWREGQTDRNASKDALINGILKVYPFAG